MIRRAHFRFLSIAFLAASTGCNSYVPVVNNDNFAYLYGKGAAAVRLDARVYQPTPTSSVIWFKLRTADLLYKGTGGGGPYHARVGISYETYASLGSNSLLDSASTYVQDESMDPNPDQELIGHMELTDHGDRPYVLRITAHDLNRDTQSTVMLNVEHGKPGGRQEFIPLRTDSLPEFNDRFPEYSHVLVRSQQHAGSILHVAHYPSITKLPAPVFAEVSPPPLDGRPDDEFTVQVDNDGLFAITTGDDGFYHIRADTASSAGYTLFVTTRSFPLVRTAQDLVAPLRYISSLKEWDAFSSTQQPRKAVERFWTDAAGGRDRARDAIAGYYGRVESANRHFSSYTEGWRTDRGLVHIIFGTPTTIRKTGTSETWTYGDETNLMSLSFTFVKRDDPYSDNDLVLQRDPRLKSAWYRNVESWRNGRILQN
jgi:GWxTD domain-containing protein